ncbi:hypothetical protein DFH06DRAFT_974271 [Mycena polygramma]|nr:hypothetical protein DFH06DRAFT_974271 [Mycena polygramma]
MQDESPTTKAVMLKRISTKIHPHEVEIAQFFSSPPQSESPRKHCVPIWEVLRDPEDADLEILVMPHFVGIQYPVFDTVGEVVDCVRQIFEASAIPRFASFFLKFWQGMEFMHQNYVAHRYVPMALCLSILPNLFHQRLSPPKFRPGSKGGGFHPITRTQCWPRFYIIDFGLSRRCDPVNRRPFEDVICGGDKTPPERVYFACNPFPTDIYFLGNFWKKDFLYADPPCDYGTASGKPETSFHPTLRPTIGEVIDRFDELCSGLSGWHLANRAKEFTCTTKSDSDSDKYPEF